MGKECRQVALFAFAFGWMLTAHAYAETTQFADPLDQTLTAPLQFDQVSQSMGSYAWDKQTGEGSLRLACRLWWKANRKPSATLSAGFPG